MLALDTNVLVRLLTNDDPVQSRRAAGLFAANAVFLSKSVLLETEWVLRWSYRAPRSAITAAFRRLAATPSVTLEDAAAVRAAIESHGAGMDFADALHVASAVHASRFVTFDRKVARQAARAKVQLTIETL
jgi:predicted nucleic-acid-binding protein